MKKIPVVLAFLVLSIIIADGYADNNACAAVDKPDIECVYIPPGTFMMGNSSGKKGSESDEFSHKVIITKGFYLQTTEVTVRQWRAFARDTGFRTSAEKNGVTGIWTGSGWKNEYGYYWDNPGFPQTDDHPVTCVSWNDVQNFIKWLNSGNDKNYRLPTEAEWEYACRAGSVSDYSFGDNPDEFGEYGWNIENAWDTGKKCTHKVGTRKPNAFGLYDMHGNVWEWCQDWFKVYPFGQVTDPSGPLWGAKRVNRGGSWISDPVQCRSANRGRSFPDRGRHNLGFRLARSVTAARENPLDIPSSNVPAVEGLDVVKDLKSVFSEQKEYRIDIGSDLRRLVFSPDGKIACAIFSGKTDIKLFSLPSFEESRIISLGDIPYDIWCNNDEIFVVLVKTGTISRIDIHTGKIIGSIGLHEPENYFPSAFPGVTSDGYLLSVWNQKKQFKDSARVYKVLGNGNLELFIKHGYSNICDTGDYVVGQEDFDDSPSGYVEILDKKTGKKEETRFFETRSHEKVDFHDDYYRIFISSKGNPVVPRTKIGDTYGYNPWTYVLTPDFSKEIFSFPGVAICEWSERNVFLSLGIEHTEKKQSPVTIYYVDSSSGSVLKKIQFLNFDPDPSVFMENAWNSAYYLKEWNLFVYSGEARYTGRISILPCNWP